MCASPWLMALTALRGINEYKQQQQQYNAQLQIYKTQADVAEQNARISQKRQEQIAEQHAYEQKRINDKMRLTAGHIANESGASGLTLSGSPMDALLASYGAWQQDSDMNLYNQRNNIWTEQQNERNYRNQATNSRMAYYNIQNQKRNNLWSTILGTGLSLYGINRRYGGYTPPKEYVNVPKLYQSFGDNGMMNGLEWHMGQVYKPLGSNVPWRKRW
ncbi:hypothetical protein C3L57_06860 [Veillonellaceae bacterium M2-8]|nr:hypothetical protein [Veillonellaceae bacterium M2-8]